MSFESNWQQASFILQRRKHASPDNTSSRIPYLSPISSNPINRSTTTTTTTTITTTLSPSSSTLTSPTTTLITPTTTTTTTTTLSSSSLLPRNVLHYPPSPSGPQTFSSSPIKQWLEKNSSTPNVSQPHSPPFSYNPTIQSEQVHQSSHSSIAPQNSSRPKLNGLFYRANSLSFSKALSSPGRSNHPSNSFKSNRNNIPPSNHHPSIKNKPSLTLSSRPAQDPLSGHYLDSIQYEPPKSPFTSDNLDTPSLPRSPLHLLPPIQADLAADLSQNLVEALASPDQSNWKQTPSDQSGLPPPFLNQSSLPLPPHSASHSMLNRQSTLSTWTVASNRSSSHEDLFSNLASIQLPPRPIEHDNQMSQTPASPIVLSDFPLPPSRYSFLDVSPTSPVSSSIELALYSPTGLHSPSMPPQIPLPPLPCSSIPSSPILLSPQNSVFRSGSIRSIVSEQLQNTLPSPPLHQADTPKSFSPPLLIPPQQRLSSLTDSIRLSDIPDVLDENFDLLHLYLDRNDFAARSILPHPPGIGPKAEASPSNTLVNLKTSTTTSTTQHIPTSFRSGPKASDPPSQYCATVEPSHSRAASGDSISCDSRRAAEMSEMMTEPQLQMYLQDLARTDSEGEETSSEIDLNEPLEAMAVRLGYQFETDEPSDSDNDSDIRRSDELEDDSDILQHLSLHCRPTLSRQTHRSQSSLRSNFPQPLKRFKRLVIAEASSSDEEEFDLTLDHRPGLHRASTGNSEIPSQHEWHERRGSSESMGTTMSFSTTPSSTQLSYPTDLSTPNSIPAVKQDLSCGGLPQHQGTIGLGFGMEILSSQRMVGSKRMAQVDQHLPGLTGSNQRREWIQRGFNRGDLTYLPPGAELPPLTRSNSLYYHQEGLYRLQPSLFNESEGHNTSDLIRRKDDPLGALMEERAPDQQGEEVQVMKSIPYRNSMRMRRNLVRNSSNGLKLKPLMLVDRKSRGLSCPSSSLNSSISKQTEARRNSVSNRSGTRTLSPTTDLHHTSSHLNFQHDRLSDLFNHIKPRPGLANISYRCSISSLAPRSPASNI